MWCLTVALTERDSERYRIFTTEFYYFILLQSTASAQSLQNFYYCFLLVIFSTEYRVGAVLERCLERDTQHMLH